MTQRSIDWFNSLPIGNQSINALFAVFVLSLRNFAPFWFITHFFASSQRISKRSEFFYSFSERFNQCETNLKKGFFLFISDFFPLQKRLFQHLIIRDGPKSPRSYLAQRTNQATTPEINDVTKRNQRLENTQFTSQIRTEFFPDASEHRPRPWRWRSCVWRARCRSRRRGSRSPGKL